MKPGASAMTFPFKATLLGALLALSACGSTPITFHTLTPAHANLPTVGGTGTIRIESLTVPPAVDRPQIVVRQGDTGIAILETQWWAASLADEMRSALVDQLANSNPRPPLLLRVDVQRFDSVPGQYARFDAQWRLRPASGTDRPSLLCRTTLQSPAGSGIDDVVLAHQNNLKRFAAQVSRAAASAAGQCPGTP